MMHNCTQSDQDQIARSFLWYFQLLQYVGVGCSVAALYAIMYFAKYCRTEYTGKNVKILLMFHVGAACIYAVFYGFTQGYHIVTRFFYTDCDILVPVKVCAFMRIPQSVTSAFFVNFYLAMNLSNILEKMWKRYRDSGWSVIFALIALAFAMIGTVPSFFVDLKSDDYMLNCASFEHKRIEIQKSIPEWYMIFNAISLGFVLILAIHQKCTSGKPVLRLKINKYVRSREFRRMLFIVLPNFFLNFLFHLYYALLLYYFATSDGINGNDYLWINATPLYVLISPMLWCKVLKKFRNKIKTQPIASPNAYARIVESAWYTTSMSQRVILYGVSNKKGCGSKCKSVFRREKIQPNHPPPVQAFRNVDEVRPRRPSQNTSGTVQTPKKGCLNKLNCFSSKNTQPNNEPPIETFHSLDEVRPRRPSQRTSGTEQTPKKGCLNKLNCFSRGPTTIKVKPMKNQTEESSGQGCFKKTFISIGKSIKNFFLKLCGCFKKQKSTLPKTSVSSVTQTRPIQGNNSAQRRAVFSMT